MQSRRQSERKDRSEDNIETDTKNAQCSKKCNVTVIYPHQTGNHCESKFKNSIDERYTTQVIKENQKKNPSWVKCALNEFKTIKISIYLLLTTRATQGEKRLLILCVLSLL